MSSENGSEQGEPASYRLRRPGGEIDRSRIINAPGIVLVIAGLIIGAFLFFIFAPRELSNSILASTVLIPARFSAGIEANGGALAMASPLITSMFIHGGIAHLVLNSFFLLAFGTPVARRIGADGALQSAGAFSSAVMFLTFFLLCGAAGSLAFIALNPAGQIPVVGASGGVYGLLGGLVRFAFNRSTLFGPEEARFNSLFDRPVLGWTAFVVLTNNPAFAALLSPMAGEGAGIAWEAHLGGYIFGLLAFPFFERAARGIR